MANQEWRTVAEIKLEDYFKLYTKFVNFAIFYLVAHRGYVSTYDLSQYNGKGAWVHHEKFSKTDHVREINVQKFQKIRIDKEDKKEEIKNLKFHAIKTATLYNSYKLQVFCGLQHVHLVQIDKVGRLKVQQSEDQRSHGIILKI